MLPSILAKQLQKGIGDYIETTFPMTNEPFKGSLTKMIAQKGSIYHEPYVAVRLPFRVAEEMPTCFEAIHPKYLPYVHQQKAFDRLTGDDGRSTLVATGTGSGKTECFLYPILEYCYQHRGERGIKALIIYPMNALATDQAKRIAELINGSDELRNNVTAGMYVGGQEKIPARMMTDHGVITDHETLLNNPPDILMTNYKMLDYLLVRPKDSLLWNDNDSETLKYIAVDELHTFDGAQGTDLACLLRRLKRRLGIYDGYLCCVGTSATMGSKENNIDITSYAEEIFGEPFEKDSIITEDRLSPEEFFDGYDITEFSMPTSEQILELERLSDEDYADTYIKNAVEYWFPDFDLDPLSDEGRIKLGEKLMHHNFMQSVIKYTGGKYYQVSKIVDDLSLHYPNLKLLPDSSATINSLFALISHARTGKISNLRPFLNVQVQLWIRELRRLLAKVDVKEIDYKIANDLNKEQAKQYLPVVNCRDCGATGWVSVLNERSNATITHLESFYNMFFKGDGGIKMMYPHDHKDNNIDINKFTLYKICPCCLNVSPAENVKNNCPNCDTEMIDILIPSKQNSNKKGRNSDNPQYECPFCGSRRGISLMGLRSATEISASISQMFASKFNDDKKTLAFSDNVQDAAHRAGFFNSRTWRFGLRTAIQRYCTEVGSGQNLEDFQNGFIKYWEDQMTDEEFVAFFIAPNMTWRKAYEDMVKNRKLGNDKAATNLKDDIKKRIKYEIMLEFGVNGKIGRTLEKSSCSVISFNREDIEEIAEIVQERVVNELGELTSETIDTFRKIVLGYLNIMVKNGAFKDPVFNTFLVNDAKDYLLSNTQVRWLPGGQSSKNIHFIGEHIGRGKKSSRIDSPYSNKYIKWIESCCDQIMVREGVFEFVSKVILEEALKRDAISQVPSSANYSIYALNKEHVLITDDVVQMRCDKCGAIYAVSSENASIWKGAPCQRSTCIGHLDEYEVDKIDYYGHLYGNGDLARINAREHTGLLERSNRELLENDFKRNKNTQEVWDPNVLSCTPTLEMGIDIGDLSTVILCSMPPAQSQFLQRAGRAGRKDGNALTLAVANAKPHDLYFYSDPLEMIEGNVIPPKIFLRASAVLERQFIAFCMDSWVKKGIPEGAIPEKVGVILNKLNIEQDSYPEDIFPFNFINYVQSSMSRLLNSFMQMFAAYLDDSTREELQEFVRGDGDLYKTAMSVNIIDAFVNLRKQRDSLKERVNDLKKLIDDIERKPKDKSNEEDLKNLNEERSALLNVIREINKKNIFNFLSDEGLLPNYAFPESGVILRAVLYRKNEEKEGIQNKKYENIIFEYNRSASSAISEFAPNNNFYVDGRKLTIDQIDLTTSKLEKWRLCPNCSHAQLEDSCANMSVCPQCGSPGWADFGQVRNMLKVQMVYSTMNYTDTLINDDSDDRSNTFYCKQLLVDVDEDNDISSAYRMDNEDFPFGYEFVKKATLREINFGEKDMNGETISISGVEDVRKGFKICKYCGKIQPETSKSVHSFSCKTRKMPMLEQADAFEECLFLYREFNTEVLRILIPATTMDSSTIKMESFVAAFMLGMREYFGNVDHLRATVSEVPVSNEDYRKQYLVIYDSVPGGTGYLKQLMHEENALVEIFEKALNVMENCSCKDDPKKDGCYHCLYAYRQSQQIGNISRKAAIKMLKSILSGKDNVKKIDKLNDIPVNPLFDSELERRFMEAIRKKVGPSNVSDTIRNGKHCYYIKINDLSWEIEPQVLLNETDGVSIPCKPDFVFWPASVENSSDPDSQKPVAVFTDGFTYHKDIVADDTLKREAIRRSGRFRVWSLTFKDVQSILTNLNDYYTETLDYSKMPSGIDKKLGNKKKIGMYIPSVKGKADMIKPYELNSFEMLFKYLELPNAEYVFKLQSKAYSYSLLDQTIKNDEIKFNNWKLVMDEIDDQIHFNDYNFIFKNTSFSSYTFTNTTAHIIVHSGISSDVAKNKGYPSVCAVIKDDKDCRTDKYERELNGFWEFFNLMQFNKNFIALSSTGIEKMVYTELPIESPTDYFELAKNSNTVNLDSNISSWNSIKELLFEDDAIEFVNILKSFDIPVVNEENIGYEVISNNGAVLGTIEIAWPEKQLGFMTEEQLEDRNSVEKLGWKIFSSADVKSLDIKKVFGGDN